jgi:hypothetical protein
MGRRNTKRYTADDWKEAGRTVGAIIANRWVVYTECELCELRIQADLKRIARERGGNLVLWGRSTVPADGMSRSSDLLGQAARCERGCGDDLVLGFWNR